MTPVAAPEATRGVRHGTLRRSGTATRMVVRSMSPSSACGLPGESKRGDGDGDGDDGDGDDGDEGEDGEGDGEDGAAAEDEEEGAGAPSGAVRGSLANMLDIIAPPPTPPGPSVTPSMLRSGLRMQMGRIKDIFRRFDADESGTIDLKEFVQALRHVFPRARCVRRPLPLACLCPSPASEPRPARRRHSPHCLLRARVARRLPGPPSHRYPSLA